MATTAPAGDRVIVCGVDDTPDGRNAGLVAVRLAVALNGHVIAVNVPASRDGRRYGTVEHPDRGTLQAAMELTHAILEESAIELELQTAPHVHVEHGEASSVLRRVASEHDADFLVVGSRTRTAIAATMRPGIPTTLTTASPCPVIVVPDRLDDIGLLAPSRWSRAIICGVDDSPQSLNAAQAAARLAATLDTRLVLAHVYQTGTELPGALPPAPAPALADIGTLMVGERRRRAKRLLKQAQAHARQAPRIELEMKQGQPAAALNDLAHEHGCSLLVVGSRGHGSLRRAMLGSTSAALTTPARRPVMVVAPTTSRLPPSASSDRRATGGLHSKDELFSD